MRRPLLILGTLLVLGGLFAIYWVTQTPAIRVVDGGGGPERGRAPVPTDAAIGPIGPGQGVWVSQYASDGRLTSKFRASDFRPRPDGTVLASYPEAEVMLSNGGVIRLVATSGTVSVRTAPAAQAGPLGTAAPQMPSRGKLQDVTIDLTDAAGQRTVAMKVNNVAFDLDTFRIYTEAYKTPDGAAVAADRVKVEVRGDDFDFDGYGLTLRWDDQSGIIQSLEVAHGERIVIKEAPAGLAGAGTASPRLATALMPGFNTNAQHAASGVAKRDVIVPLYRPIELASADPSTVATAPPTSQPAKRLIPYRVKLLDAVRIVQGDQTLGSGDLLTIDFLNEARGDKDKEAKQPSTRPAAAATAPAVAPPPPTPTTVVAAPATAPLATTAPAVAATAPAPPQPIVVYWTGPLRMVPLEKADAPLGELTPGNAIAALSGQKVLLQQAGATVTAGSALYRTADGGAALRPAAGQSTVTIADADGRTLTTAAIDYDGFKKVATLNGPGRLNVPPTPETDGKPVTAQWARGATIHLASDAKGEQTLDRIDLAGDVAVAHPQLDLTSQQLGIHFAPGADPKKPAVRQVTASDRVKVVTRDEKDKARTQTIESDDLALDMTTDVKGNPTPNRFTARGNVRAYDDEQKLQSDTLAATIGVAGKAADEVELKDLVAQGRVKITGKDGASASADRLNVTMTDGKARIELTGPDGATIASGDGNVRGKTIVVTPDTGLATVAGAGSLDAVQGKGKDRRPVRVTWETGATLDSKKDLVEVTGNVRVESKLPDGSRTETSRSDRVLITLADRATAPAGAKKNDDKAADRSPIGGVSDNAFGDKEPVAVTLLGKVEVGTVEQADGQLAQRFTMQADEARYDLKTDKMLVPGPGRALYEDLRTGDAAGEAGGSTAIGWKKSLSIDTTTNKANVDGDVVIKHVPLDRAADALQVYATAIDVDLIPTEKTAATTAKASQPPIAVKRVLAHGPVTFVSGARTFDGTTLTYDADTGIVTATGSDASPLRVVDGPMTGTATSVRYNLKTGKVESIDNFIATARK